MTRELYVRSEDGNYYIDCHPHGTLVTHLTPIDTTNWKTWADSIIEKTEDATAKGFGNCVDGTPYDLNNFLCDLHGGGVPWKDDQMAELYKELLAHPRFVSAMTAFEAKYGDINFPLTWEAYCKAAGLED